MTSVLEEMKRQGAVLVDPADLESHGKFDDTEFTVLLYELKADLNAYLVGRPDAPVHSLKEIIEFNERNKGKEMPYFAQDTFIKAEAKGPLTSKEYLDALEANHRLSRAEGIDGLMDKLHLDAIMAPTGGPAWLTDLINGDHANRLLAFAVIPGQSIHQRAFARPRRARNPGKIRLSSIGEQDAQQLFRVRLVIFDCGNGARNGANVAAAHPFGPFADAGAHCDVNP